MSVVSEADREMFEKFPCSLRDEDGACAACAWMAECGFPELCKCREEPKDLSMKGSEGHR